MARKIIDQLSTGLLLTLGLLGIIGPFGSDLYLPAFPQIAADLATGAAGVQFTLTCYTIGLALGQLVLGSFSDWVGRKPVVVLGTAMMTAASLFAAWSKTIYMLMIACALIGSAAAAVQVASRAIISDLAHGPAAARGFSVMGTVMGFGPILGPIAGALAMSFGDWRTIFFSFAAMNLLFTGVAILGVPESLAPENRHSGGFKQMLSSMRGIIANRNFLWHASILWAGFAMLFAYISASPFVLQSIFGLSPFEYTVAFGINGAGLMLTGTLSGVIMNRVPPERQLRLAVTALAVAAGLLGGGWLLQSLNLGLVALAFFLTPLSLGFLFGPVTALGLRQVRHANGTALAIQGSVQFVIAGVAAFVVGLAGASEIGPLVATYVVLASCAVFSLSRVSRLKVV